MVESNPNPFAAPAVAESSADLHYQRPLTVYFYAGIVLCIALCFGLVGWFVMASILLGTMGFFVTMPPAFMVGVWAASRMFQRLDGIHREMQAWEIAQRERIGELIS